MKLILTCYETVIYYFHAENVQIEGEARSQWPGPIPHHAGRLVRSPSPQHLELLQIGQPVGPDAAVGRTGGGGGVVPQGHHCQQPATRRDHCCSEGPDEERSQGKKAHRLASQEISSGIEGQDFQATDRQGGEGTDPAERIHTY